VSLERNEYRAFHGRQRVLIFTFGEVGDAMDKHLHGAGDSHTSVVAKGALLVRTTGEPDMVLKPGDFVEWPAGTEHEWECVKAPAILINHFKPRAA
jgi:quercetin dioxygenase-like cupin family protein